MAVDPSAVRQRRLIVNADDFGQTAGINDGIIRCYEAGVVTSASLMVRWPLAAAAAAYARQQPAMSIGLHVDLGEWVLRNGEWLPLYEVLPALDETGVRDETLRQLDTFRRLLARDPSHIDSHQHIHRQEPVRTIVVEIGERLGIPCRHTSDRVRYCGEFYGQTSRGEILREAIDVEQLIRILKELPDGTTELGCHPGLRNDAPGVYISEREAEARALCDARVRETLCDESIDLISFAAVRV